MFQGKVKTEWLTKGALSPTLALPHLLSDAKLQEQGDKRGICFWF
jgi:hypothetical protein